MPYPWAVSLRETINRWWSKALTTAVPMNSATTLPGPLFVNFCPVAVGPAVPGEPAVPGAGVPRFGTGVPGFGAGTLVLGGVLGGVFGLATCGCGCWVGAGLDLSAGCRCDVVIGLAPGILSFAGLLVVTSWLIRNTSMPTRIIVRSMRATTGRLGTLIPLDYAYLALFASISKAPIVFGNRRGSRRRVPREHPRAQ
ncbi:MAG: hypothetical protein JWO35_685 [Candidatus Saccharibacteria bacterium]|nr:hypothetical protein [Candidatus Saccharibacteria bacterium]